MSQPNDTQPLFAGAPPQRSRLSWAAIGAAAIALLIVLGVVLLVSHNKATADAKPLDSYAASLSLSDIQMSESTSLSGGKSTFIDGHIHNNGTRTLTAATVSVRFSNDMNLPPQVESVPLMVVRTHEPYTDTQTLNAAPLHSGEDREFRLTFEAIASNWNQQLPEVRFTRTSVK